MIRKFLAGPGPVHAPTVILTYALAVAAGFLARFLHIPLPMLLGPLLVIAALAILDIRPLGHSVAVLPGLRTIFVPVIGVAIGAAFRPEMLDQAANWLPSLLAMALFTPLVHWAGYRTVRAMGLDRTTSVYGTMPGGWLEALQMGEDAGADARMIAILQFLRLILTIILVPVAFTWISGQAVGSASGAAMPGSDLGLTLTDAALLTAAGILGYVVGRALRFPAPQMTGPILVSGLVHLTGLTQTVPPGWLIAVTQVVIGTALGTRFAGMPKGQLRRGFRLALAQQAVMMAAAGLATVLVMRLVDEPASAVFLAFAPGGLVEMSLVALSLNLSIVYVSAHHVLRIVLAVVVARAVTRRR